MRVSAALVCLLFPFAAMADERQTIATFAGGVSVIGPWDPGGPEDDQIGGPEDVALQLRATISFEEAPPPYKEPKGYVFRGTLVPEILAGTLMVDEDRAAFVGGGARLEAAFSQRKMGLLEVSARGGMYLAARGGLFTDEDHTPFFEGAFGEYFLIGDSARIGIELGIMSIRTARYQAVPVAVDGALAGPPFRQGDGSYLDVNAAFYLGVTL